MGGTPDILKTILGRKAEGRILQKEAMAFVGLGSAAFDFYGGDRHGENLFANSVVALDARSGRRLWHFQTIHHDLWDYDLTATPVLLTIERDDEPVDIVAQATKT